MGVDVPVGIGDAVGDGVIVDNDVALGATVAVLDACTVAVAGSVFVVVGSAVADAVAVAVTLCDGRSGDRAVSVAVAVAVAGGTTRVGVAVFGAGWVTGVTWSG